MSIKIPSISILDQLLHGLGKKRGLMVPEKAYEKYGPYAYVFARKESFWVALFRPKNKNLPEG